MRFDIGELPPSPIEAAATFYAEVAPLVERALIVPLSGKGLEPELVEAGQPGAPETPPMSPDEEEARQDGLVLVFGPADHTHRGWRLAAVQMLARAHAPLRINAVASSDERAIAAAERYIVAAPGVTGQYWALDGNGAGEVLS